MVEPRIWPLPLGTAMGVEVLSLIVMSDSDSHARGIIPQLKWFQPTSGQADHSVNAHELDDVF